MRLPGVWRIGLQDDSAPCPARSAGSAVSEEQLGADRGKRRRSSFKTRLYAFASRAVCRGAAGKRRVEGCYAAPTLAHDIALISRSCREKCCQGSRSSPCGLGVDQRIFCAVVWSWFSELRHCAFGPLLAGNGRNPPSSSSPRLPSHRESNVCLSGCVL